MPKLNLRPPLTVVLTLEGLSASSLGCYGCSWNSTPAIDALASQGIVWDRWTTPDDRPGGLIRRWLGDSVSAVQEWVDDGSVMFFTDDGRLELPDSLAKRDGSFRLPPPSPGATSAAVGETALDRSAEAIANEVDDATRLVWFHSSVLRDCWDAPSEEIFAADSGEFGSPDEDAEGGGNEGVSPAGMADREPELKSAFSLPESAHPPVHQLSAKDDPDLLFAWMQRYADQVRNLDRVVDEISHGLRRRRPQFMIAGSSGFSLGENGWIGHRVGALRSSDLRLPLLISRGGPLRVPGLTNANHFSELLVRLIGRRPLVEPSEWGKSEEPFSTRVATESERADAAVTTPGWFYVRDQAGEEGAAAPDRLYLKPDDINDVNDVARLRREVVEAFSEEGD